MSDDWRAGGFGLYVHWPFCQSKCPYCDFNSHVVANVDQTRWATALASEITRYREETGPRVLQSIFFGGGTPSLMAPETVATVMEAARAAWPTVNELEVTLEANPTSVEAGRFAGYRDAGVNRVSMGVQALNDTDLRRLGRMHTVAEAQTAFDVARNVFERVSFDLIYARQDQDAAAWEAELREALSMAIDHLSLYQLTIEDGTVFGARHAVGHLRGLPDEDRAADMWDITQEVCAAAGMPSYEISNHARPGAESKHNLLYWKTGDYVGVGPGAHGRLTLGEQRFSTEAARMPGEWLSAVESRGSAEIARDELTTEDRLAELLLMGMRLRSGVDLSRARAFGWSPDVASELEANRLVTISNDHIAVTDQGRPILNAVLRELLA
ncbi:radical SAM family heme chaperone HemW [Pelagovum pacificum]|uniref:Heme chaperone HemW n=1 Tax=Pelagovum pacificum TaxID=2588711 RepID=A0A5C5GKV1_9RHOB|nr:radical SAM family heme chaperone HemW [Pelagovum pacificum]QQA45054.1 coproporphyrinogen III oxidase [Pelagovum pacificum]TNY34401.1 coproporphyrinogen III oxidase [Pelagovum pacificum]